MNPYDNTDPITCADCNDDDPAVTMERFNPQTGMRDRLQVCHECARQWEEFDPTDDGDAAYDAWAEDRSA